MTETRLSADGGVGRSVGVSECVPIKQARSRIFSGARTRTRSTLESRYASSASPRWPPKPFGRQRRRSTYTRKFQNREREGLESTIHNEGISATCAWSACACVWVSVYGINVRIVVLYMADTTHSHTDSDVNEDDDNDMLSCLYLGRCDTYIHNRSDLYGGI